MVRSMAFGAMLMKALLILPINLLLMQDMAATWPPSCKCGATLLPNSYSNTLWHSCDDNSVTEQGYITAVIHQEAIERVWPYFRLSRPSLGGILFIVTTSKGRARVACNVPPWRQSPQQVTLTSARALGREKAWRIAPVTSLSSLFVLFTSSSSSSPPSEAIYQNPTMTFARTCYGALPEPLRGFARWFAEPGAAPSQWAGILLATMETYNMPGNRGNRRGGDKTHGNWHLSSHSFGKCDMWPSSLILLHLKQDLDSILLSAFWNQSDFCTRPTFTTVAAPDTAAAAARICVRRRRNTISGAREHRRGVS